MVKLVCCLRRCPDITREEFAKHWREKHIHTAGRDAARVLGIRRRTVFFLAEENVVIDGPTS